MSSTIVVLDTNVLVSALCLPRSLPADLLRRWLNREFDMLLSMEILAELLDVLHRPKIVRRFGITTLQAEAFSQILRDFCILTPGTLIVDAVPDDPKDNHVVACALEGSASFIISGDRHLQVLNEYEGIRILSPAQFMSLLQTD